MEFGGRLGLLAEQDRAVVAWTDTRNSLDDTTGQDIFAADVVVPGGEDSARQRVGWLMMGGGAVALAVVVLHRRGARRQRQ